MRVLSAAHKLKTNGTGPAQNYFASFSFVFYASPNSSLEFQRSFLARLLLSTFFLARSAPCFYGKLNGGTVKIREQFSRNKQENIVKY